MVKTKILIDTNIMIDFLRKKKKVKTLLEKIIENNDLPFIISSATIQELFAGQSSKKTKEKQKIKQLLNIFRIINVDHEIAEMAGEIMRDNQRVVQFADAQIAATTIFEKAYLLTKNKKDFQNIKGLEIYEN